MCAGTHLTVIHDMLTEGSTTATLASFGWPHVIAGLKMLLETGEAVDFTPPVEADCAVQPHADRGDACYGA